MIIAIGIVINRFIPVDTGNIVILMDHKGYQYFHHGQHINKAQANPSFDYDTPPLPPRIQHTCTHIHKYTHQSKCGTTLQTPHD